MKILIVTPAKNEAQYIGKLMDSMRTQSHLPHAWVIVDDGSTDGMGSLIEEAAKTDKYLTYLRKDTAGQARSGGSKVVQAFNFGYQQVKHLEHDIVIKLDGDLILPPDYLESLVSAFQSNPKLGLCGGYCSIEQQGKWVREKNHDYHVRGAFKAYRRTCFEEIGGFIETWNWDGLDTMQTMNKGWEIKVIDKEVKHLRPTSAAYDSVQHARKSGVEAYRTGNDLFLALIRAFVRIKQSKNLNCGLAYMRGFVGAWKQKAPKVVDPELENFIRRFTYKRVLTPFLH